MVVWQNFIIYYGLQIIILSFRNGKRIKIFFFSSTFWNSFKDFLVLFDVTFKLRIIWALISPRNHNVLNISSLSCSENLEKHFSLQVNQQGGSIFRSGISVPLLKDLYAYPVFRSNLHSFIFHSDGTALYLFWSSASCFLSLWSDLYFVVH
jgi:flavin reductase (DIM6/NTAB) family NADH-FMN oxidoreductase RutF